MHEFQEVAHFEYYLRRIDLDATEHSLGTEVKIE